MAGRILGGSCGNVRLFSVPSPSFSLSFSLSLLVLSPSSCSSSLPLWRARLFFLHLDRLHDSFLPRIHLPSLPPRSFRALVLFIETGCLRVPLGSSGSPSAVHSVVCPIFTHGKSTLKRRWTPARSSTLSSPKHLRCALLLSCIAAASQ